MKETPFKLLVEYAPAPDRQRALTFAKDRVSIGRAHSNDVRLLSPARLVSRQHAEIRREESGFWIVDLGSKRATWLNGRRLEVDRPYALQRGDRLLVGDFQIEFVTDASLFVFIHRRFNLGFFAQTPEKGY